MCLDNPDEIIAELHRLREARAAREKWPPPSPPGSDDDGGMHMLPVTTEEGLRLLNQRIEDAEASIKQLGFTGPIKRVDDGDNQRIMSQR